MTNRSALGEGVLAVLPVSLLRLGGRKVGETLQFAEECMAPHKNDILDPC